jgi:hypothetical protein
MRNDSDGNRLGKIRVLRAQDKRQSTEDSVKCRRTMDVYRLRVTTNVEILGGQSTGHYERTVNANEGELDHTSCIAQG